MSPSSLARSLASPLLPRSPAPLRLARLASPRLSHRLASPLASPLALSLCFWHRPSPLALPLSLSLCFWHRLSPRSATSRLASRWLPSLCLVARASLRLCGLIRFASLRGSLRFASLHLALLRFALRIALPAPSHSWSRTSE